MDDKSLKNVLGILRVVNAASDQITAMQFIQALITGQTPRPNIVGSQKPAVDPAVVARVCAYILDQLAQARTVIDNSQLVEEAKSGVRAAVTALESTFSISALNGSISSLKVGTPGYISNFVILLSATGVATNQENPKDASDLATEIDEMIESFSDIALDPVVRDVGRKHLAALATLLRHVSIFGVEAAMSAYFDLVMRLRRVDIKTTPESKNALDKVFSKIKSWGERLGQIDKVVNDGARLLEHVEHARGILEYIPDLID